MKIDYNNPYHISKFVMVKQHEAYKAVPWIFHIYAHLYFVIIWNRKIQNFEFMYNIISHLANILALKNSWHRFVGFMLLNHWDHIKHYIFTFCSQNSQNTKIKDCVITPSPWHNHSNNDISWKDNFITNILI